jgi:DNA-binding CsgD family transcriptional regulator
MSENGPINKDDARKGAAKPIVIDDLATQSIDLADLLTKDITSSGSFDIRGEIWATTFGKLLQALPIPGMLLDDSFNVVVVNQACGKISSQYESILNTRFSRLFSSPSDARNMQSIVEEAFSTRKPKVVGASLRIGKSGDIWCRMTFRSLRIIQERFLLVLIEDLSAEKQQLALNKKHQEELQSVHQEMEKRVKDRTAQLSQANDNLRREIAERQKAEKALKEIVSTIEGQLKELKEGIIFRLRLSLQPLIDQLKAETGSESGQHLLQALDYHLANALSSLGTKPSQKLALLTPREVQTCNLIVSGLTSKQIAKAMGVSVDAVNSHRLHIRKKLGLDLSGQPLATWLKFQYAL